MIPPKQATRLAVDALTFPDEPRAVRDVNGDLVILGESFTVKLDLRPDLPPGWGAWGLEMPALESPLAVEVRGPMLLLQSQRAPAVVQLPFAYVQQLRVREYSHLKTAGLVLGILAGAAAVTVTALYLTAPHGI